MINCPLPPPPPQPLLPVPNKPYGLSGRQAPHLLTLTQGNTFVNAQPQRAGDLHRVHPRNATEATRTKPPVCQEGNATSLQFLFSPRRVMLRLPAPATSEVSVKLGQGVAVDVSVHHPPSFKSADTSTSFHGQTRQTRQRFDFSRSPPPLPLQDFPVFSFFLLAVTLTSNPRYRFFGPIVCGKRQRGLGVEGGGRSYGLPPSPLNNIHSPVLSKYGKC